MINPPFPSVTLVIFRLEVLWLRGVFSISSLVFHMKCRPRLLTSVCSSMVIVEPLNLENVLKISIKMSCFKEIVSFDYHILRYSLSRQCERSLLTGIQYFYHRELSFHVN